MLTTKTVFTYKHIDVFCLCVCVRQLRTAAEQSALSRHAQQCARVRLHKNQGQSRRPTVRIPVLYLIKPLSQGSPRYRPPDTLPLPPFHCYYIGNTINKCNR